MQHLSQVGLTPTTLAVGAQGPALPRALRGRWRADPGALAPAARLEVMCAEPVPRLLASLLPCSGPSVHHERLQGRQRPLRPPRGQPRRRGPEPDGPSSTRVPAPQQRLCCQAHRPLHLHGHRQRAKKKDSGECSSWGIRSRGVQGQGPAPAQQAMSETPTRLPPATRGLGDSRVTAESLPLTPSPGPALSGLARVCNCRGVGCLVSAGGPRARRLPGHQQPSQIQQHHSGQPATGQAGVGRAPQVTADCLARALAQPLSHPPQREHWRGGGRAGGTGLDPLSLCAEKQASGPTSPACSCPSVLTVLSLWASQGPWARV